MFSKSLYNDWETLVKKQLKTEDIYSILSKDNLEGIAVKPYYDKVSKPLANLPKVEESTQLVADYLEDSEEEVYAYILQQNVEGLEEKTIFLANEVLADHVKIDDSNTYFSLVDVLDENTATIHHKLAQELLSKSLDRSLCVDVSVLQNAGASIVQQLAYAMSKTKELVEVFGVEILDQIVIKTAVGANYFFEIAKIRALKILFYQLSKELGLPSVSYIFAENSLRNKAKNDEENNLIRSTLELAAAMIAGADAVYSNNFKLENATDLSGEISFKQQIVLAYESIINVFEDAANGSYFVEEITQQLCEKAWDKFVEVEEKGGYLELLKQKEIQKEIYQHAIAEQNWVAEGKIKLIGVNLYPKLEMTKTVEELYNENTIKPVRWAEMYE
jgi:methylmalonyl-CoA mutase